MAIPNPETYDHLCALPPEAYLDPENFVTAADSLPGNASRKQEQYQKGLAIGRESREVTIGRGGTWGAVGPTSASFSQEGIGYHSCTADLLRGFLDSGVAIRVYRFTDENPIGDGTLIRPSTFDRAAICEAIRALRPTERPGTREAIASLRSRIERLMPAGDIDQPAQEAVEAAVEHATWATPADWPPEYFIERFRTMEGVRSWTNDRDNEVLTVGLGGGTRYTYDFDVCRPARGWQQFDTEQDASYFGVWVHVAGRLTLTFAEGDLTLVVCPTVETFRAEIADAERFYGAAPPAAIGIAEDGSVTHYFAERLSASRI